VAAWWCASDVGIRPFSSGGYCYVCKLLLHGCCDLLSYDDCYLLLDDVGHLLLDGVGHLLLDNVGDLLVDDDFDLFLDGVLSDGLERFPASSPFDPLSAYTVVP
jgi:hypothetical protein